MKMHFTTTKKIAVAFAVFAAALLLFCCCFLAIFSRDYRDIISIESEKYEIEPSLVHAIIFAESGYDEGAVSSAGAVGLMQVLPSTAKWCAESIDELEWDEEKLFEPQYNIKIGVYYIAYLLNIFNETDALAAYNAGEGNVRAWREVSADYIPFTETANYVKKVEFAKKVYETIL